MSSKQIVAFVEGCDMVGKTQIARELSRLTGSHYFKPSSEHKTFLSSRTSKQSLFIEQLRHADPRLFDFIKQTGVSVTFDRGFPSEYVYSRVFCRETDHTMLKHMDEMWASLGAVIILCYRTSYAGIVDDLDASIDEHKLAQITAEYFEWADAVTKCRVIKLCVDDENLKREVSEVLSFLGVKE